jgi:hypothetical protein
MESKPRNANDSNATVGAAGLVIKEMLVHCLRHRHQEQVLYEASKK